MKQAAPVPVEKKTEEGVMEKGINSNLKFRFSSLFLPYCGEVVVITRVNWSTRGKPPPKPNSLTGTSYESAPATPVSSNTCDWQKK